MEPTSCHAHRQYRYSPCGAVYERSATKHVHRLDIDFGYRFTLSSYKKGRRRVLKYIKVIKVKDLSRRLDSRRKLKLTPSKEGFEYCLPQ